YPGDFFLFVHVQVDLVGRRESVLCTLYMHASLVQTRRQGLGIFIHACGIFSSVSTRLIQRIGQCSNSIPVSIVYQTRELSAFHFGFNLLLSNNYSSLWTEQAFVS